MANLLSCSKISKTFSAYPLFQGISLSIEDGAKIGLIGPNGAGKSTFLRILAGVEAPDSGDIISKRSLQIAYLAQTDQFAPHITIHQHIFNQTSDVLTEAERHRRVGELLSLTGFESDDILISSLSGGWKKRLALASALVKQPDLLLLDEPTNHLDLEGIVWLEEFLQSAPFAYVVISHDRAFLENSTTKMIEISRRYPNGYISVEGNYSEFLQRREDYLAQLSKQEQSLANVVRREVEWLRRGAKARSTKQTARIDRAEKLINNLGEARSRAQAVSTVQIDFSNTGRETKQLIVLNKVKKSFGEKTIVADLDFILLKGMKIGLLGENGSGKSTVIKLLSGELDIDSGEIFRAPNLKIVTFDQQRNSLDPSITLTKFLAPDGDSVLFQGGMLHIASYAKKFRFEQRLLDVPVKNLSGGEQARLLIAKLMLQPADVLLLDEPTNDLDIDTLQVLEENLISFPGAVVLITHDRFMIDSVCTKFIAIEKGRYEYFSSYDQWREHQNEIEKIRGKTILQPTPKEEVASKKEIIRIERSLEKAEVQLRSIEKEVEKYSIDPMGPEYRAACKKLAEAQSVVERLFTSWAKLQS